MKKIFILAGVTSLIYGAHVPKMNIGGFAGVVNPKGKTRIIIKNINFEKDTMYNGNDKINDPKNRDVKVNKTVIGIKSGIGHNLELIFRIPFVNKKLSQTVKKKSFDMKNSGIGDIVFLTRYSLANQKKGDFAFMEIGAGIKLPTGSTDKSFNTPMGIKKPNQTQPLQNGSGSYDYLVDFGITKFIKNSRIDFNTNYIYTTKGDNEYEFGNQFKFNIGYLRSLNHIFSWQIELDGIHLDKDEKNGKKVNTTGGNFLYITPGIQFQVTKKFDISFGYQKLIIRDNNYDSSIKMGGLSEDYRVLIRFGYNF